MLSFILIYWSIKLVTLNRIYSGLYHTPRSRISTRRSAKKEEKGGGSNRGSVFSSKATYFTNISKEKKVKAISNKLKKYRYEMKKWYKIGKTVIRRQNDTSSVSSVLKNEIQSIYIFFSDCTKKEVRIGGGRGKGLIEMELIN